MATPLGYNALIARFKLAAPLLRQAFWLGERAAETRTQAADGTERIELPRGRASARVTLPLHPERSELRGLESCRKIGRAGRPWGTPG